MRWLTGSLRYKLLGVFALGMAIVFAAALYGFAAARGGLQTVARVNDTLVDQAIQSLMLEAAFKEQVQSWLAVLVRGHDAEDLEKGWKQFAFREREVRRIGEKLQNEVELATAKELLGKFLQAHAAMGEKYRRGLEAFKASGFDARQADAGLKGIDLEPTFLIEELTAEMRGKAQGAVAGARQDATRGLAISLGAIAAAIVAALAMCGLLLMRMILRPLAHAVGVTERVAAGDLTVQVAVASHDETGRLLQGMRTMRERLAEAVALIRQSAQNVGTGSGEIAAGHANLSSRTEEQASSLEQTAASMEELATTVRQNAEHAEQARQIAERASHSAAVGGKVMGRAVGKMNGINEASRKIAEITGVIDGIAFQTNILALNAAVEAARAGEQGRGFAVVASEVRALAQRSATAAKDIKALIQDSANEVGEGVKFVDEAGKAMDEIVSSVKKVTDMMSEIAAASRDQLSGIEQVSRAMSQMDHVVQQNAALVEESAAATQNMAAQAEQLVHAVARFKLDSGDAGESGGAAGALVEAQPHGDEAAPPPVLGSERPRMIESRQ
jgi:methyl-accepting chemotaxis protein-1 (serine sensor receptor)